MTPTDNISGRRTAISGGRGFTLFEVMVVVFIFSIVLVATYSVLTIARTSYQTSEVKIALQQEARKAMDRIAAELREASSVNLGDEYPFTVWGERIKYEVVSGQLQRVVQGESPTVVANDVGNLQLSLFGGDMVYITLTTQKTTLFGRSVTTTLTSQVGLRN